MPGSPGTVADADEALAVAEAIGFPVIIKATAGGGGKGMRVALDAEQFAQSFSLAQNEALAAFGNGAVYVEKYLEPARATSRSRSWATATARSSTSGERDCSVQRRHQKLIEESPSPGAHARAAAPDGRGGGARWPPPSATSAPARIEFLLDEDGSFYFMEMNTRIQVEHPVTEMVTGFDLVKEQIRVAAGEPLSFQGDGRYAPRPRHRVPDQRRGSRTGTSSPCPGLITAYHPPGGPGVRVDTHVYAGYTVPPYYDSLLAKVIVHGNDRAGGAGADGPGARQLHPRGRHHHDPVPGARHPASRLRRRATVDTKFLEREPQLLRTRGMKLDVVFSPLGLAPERGRRAGPSFVIDMLRATTIICAALAPRGAGRPPGRLDRGGAPPRPDPRAATTSCSRASAKRCRIAGLRASATAPSK